ncbi:SbcC/MukB-like Walker B domain-containing protein [Massilia niabensis]|uniref:SbcC/MukB-like Walker B domain-containing protein n=1 Tax=Massilia niabensis TaxID=544910 RepID=A0ABW0L8K5_9BURK
MKQLVSIKLIQFFLYEKEEFQVGLNTGIFGPNGAGKSAALDAVQIALFGANQNLTALNAQAEDATGKRTIREYCLGQSGGPDERARDVATTYITLTFRDTDTNAPVTVGVCIHASVDQERHEVLGRYVIPDLELAIGDHLEEADGKLRPRDWKSFRHSLLQRSRLPEDEIIFTSSGEQFVKGYLLALRGKNGAANMQAFQRALRFALRLNLGSSVDGIVRDEILEHKPTDTKKFKDNVRSFKEHVDLIATVKSKIAGGEAIVEQLAKAQQESVRAATWDATQVACIRETMFSRLEEARQSKLAADEQHGLALAQLDNAKEALSSTRALIDHLRVQRDAHHAHRDHGALQASIEEGRQRITRSDREVSAFLYQTDKILANCAAHPALLSSTASTLLACRAKLPSAVDDALGLSQGDRDTLGEIVRRQASAVGGELMKLAMALNNELAHKQADLTKAQDELDQINTGGPGLSGDTKRLWAALKALGLHPEPVFHLVRVTDATWQPVIEAMLGSHRDALIIPEGEERASFDCYQSLDGIYGIKMGMASRQNLGFVPKTGSIAQLIVGDNPAAVAYVRAKFVDFMCAESSKDALAAGRALTKDGMRVAGGDLDRIRPVPAKEFRLGRTNADRRAELARLVSRLTTEVVQLQTQYNVVDALVKDVGWLSRPATWEQVLATIALAKQARDEKALLDERMANSADVEYQRLNRDLEAAMKRMPTLEKELEGFQERILTANSRAVTAQQSAHKAEEGHAEVSDTFNTARANPDYDPTLASTLWDQCLEQYGEAYEAMAGHCRKQADAARVRLENAKSRGMSSFGTFLTDHREQVDLSVQENWRQARDWVAALIQRLRDIALVEHEARAEEAYRVAQDAFTTDVAVRLNEQIEAMERTRSRLNTALLACPAFSNNERYEFVITPRPALEGLLKFVRDAAGLMFSPGGEMPEQFRMLLDDVVVDGNRGARNALEDYREFFSFDIAIHREDPSTGTRRRIGYLSARLGKGSGGEHRAPLYVIAGAALSSAYKLDAKNRDSMGLIMLDEAFHRMDVTNIIATMRYYEDLGLQVLLAGPGEHLATLTAFLHRYYLLVKGTSSNAIELDRHTISAEARELYRSDLPEFHPELVDEELRRIVAPTAHTADSSGVTQLVEA